MRNKKATREKTQTGKWKRRNNRGKVNRRKRNSIYVSEEEREEIKRKMNKRRIILKPRN